MRPEMDYSKLWGLIRERFKTMAKFAQAMEKNTCTISQKLNNKSDWTAPEMGLACELLGQPPEAIPTLFFTPKC